MTRSGIVRRTVISHRMGIMAAIFGPVGAGSAAAAVAALAASVCGAMELRPPDQAERLRAIGATQGLPRPLEIALQPGNDFEPVPVPRPGDWLAEHHEPGQTFDDFIRSKPIRPHGIRRRIYLLPVGTFPEDRSPPLRRLRDYASAYFAVDVEVLPARPIGDFGVTRRVNPLTGRQQLLTTDILDLLSRRFPIDAFCLLAITMEDLYPHPSWNFVFGQASLRERVGVFSLARYDPAFCGQGRGGDHALLLRRSCRVLVHETAHLFSLAHCIFFRCVLNGSNHLQESDSRPLSLCPVCLRKLHFSIGFSVVDRYRTLLSWYRNQGYGKEARWVEGRLRKIVEGERSDGRVSDE